MDQLHTSDDKEWGDCDEQGIGPFASNIFKRGIDLTAGVGVEDLDCQPERATRRFNFPQLPLGSRGRSPSDEDGDTSGPRHQIPQVLQPLRR
jgi:hypothetical protein